MRALIRTVTVAVLSAALVAAGTPAGAVLPAEDPAPADCRIVPPAKVAISAYHSQFLVPLAGVCDSPDIGFAAWDLENPRTGDVVERVMYLASPEPQLVDWWALEDGFGTFTYSPIGAFDEEMNPWEQNRVTTVVKAASRATVITARNRSTVSLTVGAAYWSVRAGRFVPWAGAPVQIQTSNAPDGRWTTVATLTTGATGTATTAVYAPSARWWRVYVPTTRSVWDDYSAATFR